METKRSKLQNSPPCGSTSIITSSALPANGGTYKSALLPLGASPTPEVVLPVPIINSPVTTKQQLPGEPILLLPASNIPLSNPLLNSKMADAAALQYSQQLLINNASLPVVLKPPSSPFALTQPLQTPSFTQPLIVLPLTGNKNMTHETENSGNSKTDSEHQKINCHSDVKKRSEKMKSPSTYDDTIFLDAHTNKSHIAKSKLKATQQKEVLTSKLSSSAKIAGSVSELSLSKQQSSDTEVTKNKSNTNSNESKSCELSNPDISKIISNLPFGWHVVGLTDLNQIGTSQVSNTSLLDTSQSLSFDTSHALEGLVRNVKNDLQTAEIKQSPKDQPSLVSINLNTSQPVTSEKTYENYPVNELTCSVKLDDIPCTHVISIKAECLEGQEVQADSGNTDDVRDNEGRWQNVNKGTNKSLVNPSIAPCKLEKQISSMCNSTPAERLGTTESQPLLTDMEWKVVGVTSIPPITSTTCIPPQTSTKSLSMDQTSTAVAITSVHSSSNSIKDDKTPRTESSSPNTIILQIPLCSPAASDLGSKKIANSSHQKAVSSEDENMCPASLRNKDNNLLQPTKSENMKWTIVGVTGSPQNELSLLSPNLSHHQNIGAISFPPVTQIVSHAPATPLIVKSPLPFINSGNVLNNPLFNLTSPVSGSSPFLVPSGISSSQSAPASYTGEKEKPILSPTNRTFTTMKETAETSTVTSTSLTTDQLNLNFSSPQSQLEWKVVGVAPLGESLGVTPLQIPTASNSPFLPLSQLNSTPLVPTGPFFIPATATSVFPNLTSTVTSVASPGISSLSAYNLPPSPVILSSSVSPMSLSMSPPSGPVISVAGTPCTSTMILSPPPSALSQTSVSNVKTFQDLAQQQHLTQLMLSQFSAYQNPVNILKLNEPNQWNVVGVVANNQVSVVSPNPSNSADLPSEIPNTASCGSTYNAQDRRSSKLIMKNQRKSKENLCNEMMKNSISATTKTIRQSLASRFKRTESDLKPQHSRCKDMITKHRQDSAKMKKNTVSSLLKMKRLQQKANGNGSSEDGEQSIEEMNDFSENEELPHKKSRTRSLRSYAGNRKLFTKTYRKMCNEGKQRQKCEEKISLRSGTQIPVPHYNPVIEEVMETPPVTLNDVEKPCEDATVSSATWNSTQESHVIKVEARSAARRRKLKVPRKMVADLDYHPFDSSSDSN